MKSPGGDPTTGFLGTIHAPPYFAYKRGLFPFLTAEAGISWTISIQALFTLSSCFAFTFDPDIPNLVDDHGLGSGQTIGGDPSSKLLPNLEVITGRYDLGSAV